MTVETVFDFERYHNIGLSTDTKPHGQTPLSTFFEYDTLIPYVTYDGTNWVVDTRGGKFGFTKEVPVTKAIDASGGAYAAGDVINDDNCCTTATSWPLAGMAAVAGGSGVILGAKLINETENQAVQYEVILFTAIPTGELMDNVANNNPIKEDMDNWVDTLAFQSSIARGAVVATTTSASPSTVGGLPILYKCAIGSTSLYFVLVTRTAYTQTASTDIKLTFEVEHL